MVNVGIVFCNPDVAQGQRQNFGGLFVGVDELHYGGGVLPLGILQHGFQALATE